MRLISNTGVYVPPSQPRPHLACVNSDSQMQVVFRPVHDCGNTDLVTHDTEEGERPGAPWGLCAAPRLIASPQCSGGTTSPNTASATAWLRPAPDTRRELAHSLTPKEHQQPSSDTRKHLLQPHRNKNTLFWNY